MRVERLETIAPSPAFGQKGEFIGGYLVDAVVEYWTQVNSDNRLGRIKRHHDSIIYISLGVRRAELKYVIWKTDQVANFDRNLTMNVIYSINFLLIAMYTPSPL